MKIMIVVGGTPDQTGETQYLVKRAQGPRPVFTFPVGELGTESPHDGAQRILSEETGLLVARGCLKSHCTASSEGEAFLVFSCESADVESHPFGEFFTWVGLWKLKPPLVTFDTAVCAAYYTAARGVRLFRA